MHRDGGSVFVRRLTEAWAAAGALTKRRVAALRAHVRRSCGATGGRQSPGSYSWPRLRREAEGRFAAGEPPEHVIAELRDRHRHDPADAPSIRTMRRWFFEARWLEPERASTSPSDGPIRPAQNGRSVRQRILAYLDSLPAPLTISALAPWYLPPHKRSP